MGRFSLSSSPEAEEEDRLERYVPNDNMIEPCAPSLNPIYVYYLEPPPKRRRRISIWWYIVAVALVAHVVARYGPPAPPQHTASLSWNDFFLEEGTRLLQSLTSLASVIPHVWHWCIHGIRQEVECAYQEWQTRREPPCPMVLETNDEWQIVGQSRAVSIVSSALNELNQHDSLFLLLTGSVGVGKHELAMQVARHIFVDCCESAVLELDGRDNADLFTSRISHHVQQQQGNGVVVILRHLDELSLRALLTLCQVLQHERVIFIATSKVGSRTIHQHLRNHESIDPIPHNELEMSIRNEVDKHFGGNVAKYFHAVAPFVPLGQADLQAILQLKVERIEQEQAGRQWKSLVLTDALAAALVGPSRIEYTEWKDKTTDETILVFSETGAEALQTESPIMNLVTAQISKCLATATPDLVGKLDYDRATSQGIVSWCVGSGTTCYESCRFKLDEISSF